MPQSPDTQESRGTRAATPPTDLRKSTPPPQGPPGHQGAFPRAQGPLGTAGPGCHPYRRDTGRDSGRQVFFCRENLSTVTPPACSL